MRQGDAASVQGGTLPRAEPQSGPERMVFEAFYLKEYRRLVKFALYLNASRHDAEDAVGDAMADAFRRWAEISDPAAWARQAVKNYVIKSKTRGLTRVRERLRERGEGRDESREDARLTVWEDREWVVQLLGSLPSAQREVMALVVDELTPTEIATVLGRDPATIRKRLQAARQRLRSELPRGRQAVAPAATMPASRGEGT